MNFDIGRMNKRVTFYKKGKTKNKYGFDSFQNQKILSCWARLLPLGDNDSKEGLAEAHDSSKKFVIRYRKTISADMTLMYQNEEYDIISISNPYGDNEVLEIIATLKTRGASHE